MKEKDIQKLINRAIVARYKTDTEGPCAPCGACRQVISEFEIPRIIMANLRGDYTVVELEGLLPFRFGADNI